MSYRILDVHLILFFFSRMGWVICVISNSKKKNRTEDLDFNLVPIPIVSRIGVVAVLDHIISTMGCRRSSWATRGGSHQFWWGSTGCVDSLVVKVVIKEVEWIWATLEIAETVGTRWAQCRRRQSLHHKINFLKMWSDPPREADWSQWGGFGWPHGWGNH